MNTSNINYSLVRPGAIIGYRLPLSERPTDPNRIWKGRVIRWHGNTLLMVELLENGYKGLREYVNVNQVVAVSEEDHV